MNFSNIASPVGTIRSHAETGGGTNIFTRQLIKLLRTLQLHYEFTVSTLLIYSKVYSITMGTSNNVVHKNISVYSRRRMKEEEQKESMYM